MPDPSITSEFSHYIIFGGATLGLVWGAVNVLFVNKVELDAANVKVNPDKPDEEDMPTTAEGCKDRMLELNKII
jgi:hypothetical protein